MTTAFLRMAPSMELVCTTRGRQPRQVSAQAEITLESTAGSTTASTTMDTEMTIPAMRPPAPALSFFMVSIPQFSGGAPLPPVSSPLTPVLVIGFLRVLQDLLQARRVQGG